MHMCVQYILWFEGIDMHAHAHPCRHVCWWHSCLKQKPSFHAESSISAVHCENVTSTFPALLWIMHGLFNLTATGLTSCGTTAHEEQSCLRGWPGPPSPQHAGASEGRTWRWHSHRGSPKPKGRDVRLGCIHIKVGMHCQVA